MAQPTKNASATAKAARGSAGAAKKTTSDVTSGTDADSEFVPSVTAQKKAPLPPRAPQPVRAKSNKNPAGPDMPAGWERITAVVPAAVPTVVPVTAPATIPASGRTAMPTGVTTSTTRKALQKLHLAQMEEAKAALLAEMELDDEAEEAAEEAASILTLADIQTMPIDDFGALGGALGDSPHSSDAGDVEIDMDMFCDIADLDKDYETLVAEHKAQKQREMVEKMTKKGAKVGRAKKVKGQTRAAVDEAKVVLKESRKRQHEGGEVKQDFKKAKPSLPAGFVPHWRDQVPTLTTKTRKANVTADTDGPLGGLTDFDAGAAAPAKGKVHHKVCDVVEILSDSECDSDSPVKARPKPRLLPSKYDPVLAVKVERSGTPMQRVDFTSMDVTVKRGGKTQASTPISLPPVIVPVIPAPGIPVYAQARWVTDYLHSVYCRLGALKGNPWELPGGDAQFIQEVWNRVYHASGYLITLGCPVFIKTKDRINDKRSYFGKRPQSNVDALFAGPDFIGNPKKIAKYAKWALRDDGPGIWGTPSPQGLKRGDTGYTEPDGIFISVHIIKVLAPFIKSTAETVYNYGYPSAAVALTCAGLERGWLRWITGYKVEDGTPFSREQVSGLVADYAQSVAGLSPRRWGLILDACRGHSLAEAPVAVSASTMETNRHQLFIGSSPVKDSDDSF